MVTLYLQFTTEDNNWGRHEYWTKDVQLKNVTSDSLWIVSDHYYEPTEEKGGCVVIKKKKKEGYAVGFFHIKVTVYSNKDFKEWVRQLIKMGYTEQKYEDVITEVNRMAPDGCTELGVYYHVCHFKKYLDRKGNSVEFVHNVDERDGNPGYHVGSIYYVQ